MSGWEISAIVALVLALLIGVAAIIVYVVAEDRLPPSRQQESLPPIVFRHEPFGTITPGLISFRSSEAHRPVTPRQFNFRNDGNDIRTREIKEDLDLYCKLTGRVARDCRCEFCRKLKEKLGT